MAASAYSNQFSSVWHKILGAIWGDEQAKSEPMWKKYLDERSTEKKYFDDVEMVDPTLWSETEEGADIDLDDFGQGIVTQYTAKKFAKRLIIPDELMEDSQYPQIYDATRMLSRTCGLTQDYDAVGVINDAFTTANGRIGGDLKAMCVSDHPIRGGSTVANVTSVPLAPSNTAVGTTLVLIDKMAGTNGFIHGNIKAQKIVGPSNYRFRFKEILKSGQKDDTANNAINSLKGEMSDEYVAVPFMSSTVDWFVKTNVERGACFVWRRKPRYKETSSNINETSTWTGSARWTTGFSNWRGYVGHDL